MRSPTLLEAQLLNEVLDMHKEEKANKYIFKDEKGNIYLTPHPTPNSPKDTAHGAFSFSPDELNIIANFEVSGPRKDDLFPESYPPIEEFLRFSVSEMIKILISE